MNESPNYYIMNQVLDYAQKLIYQGESPFAAGLWINNKLFIAGNKSHTAKNPNLHAEIVCINEFFKQNSSEPLEKAILFSSCEPCLMCFHYIYNSGIRHIVYSASIEDAIKYNSGDLPIHIDNYAIQMNMDIEIEGLLLRERACDIFKECVTFKGQL